MRTPARFGLSIFLAALAIVQPLLAFDYPLSDEAIRDAYFLGKANDARTAAFLAKYTQHFPAPKTGPHIAEIGIETPFVQVLKHSVEIINYHAPDAEQDFLGNPMTFRVYVEIFMTATYWPMNRGPLSMDMSAPSFWKDFKIQLLQDKEIPAESVHASPLLPNCGGEGVSCLPDGVRVELDYDPDRIASAPATVRVLAPDGQDVKATFDLAALR
jgi:hypothetical protein